MKKGKGQKTAPAARKEQRAAVPPASGALLTCMQVFFPVCLWAVGLFHETASCAAALFLLGWLFFAWRKNGALQAPKTATALAAALIPLCFLLSELWAVDRGMTVMGAVKFLPLPLFCLALAQLDGDGRRRLAELIPPTGAVMTVASLLLGQIPALEIYLFVNGRLAGPLQYPNTFALLLLLGVIVLARRERQTVMSMLCALALLAGIFLTGSRTTMALLVLTAVVLCAVGKGKRRWTLPCAVAALLAGTGIYAAATGRMSGVGRYLTASLGSSTLLGRLLYFRDALPVIVRHPLGLGYLGYYSLQGSFQTGVYAVQNIHNELLQLLLDVGWLPTAAMLFALVRSMLPGRNCALGRLLTGAICLHCMMEFDMQFVAMGFVLLLAMDMTAQQTVTVRAKGPALAAGIAAACACLYFGAASGLYYFHAPDKAAALYPGYTNAWVQMLPQAQTPEQMDEIADRVLACNDSVSLAHSAKARAAYAQGDFAVVIREKERAIGLARYQLSEYLDYMDMLAVGEQLYSQSGDEQSAAYCRQRIAAIPDMLAAVEADTSPLAWRIDEKPELTLPAEYAAMAKAASEGT